MIGRFAERMLPRIFRPDDPSLTVRLPPEAQQALEQTLEDLPAAVFRADDALGWTYQFWQTDRKDAVNRSEAKIGADELPAVTQLFTERYMVRFLFHNTVGAWRAGKVLALRRELAKTAEGEAALREAVRLGAAGGYEFDYLRFVRESSDDRNGTAPPGRWRPASGSFAEWPRQARNLKVLDPCCGSGHFLVEGLQLFARLRMEEENVPLDEAIRAVLRENLHGLEIDPRCAQIAAFTVAFAAWKLAGRAIELPPLNIACSGLAPNSTKEEWLLLAERAAATAGSAPRKDLFVRRETLQSSALRETFGALHDLFVEAPTLGSLIDPSTAGASLFAARFNSMQPLVESVLHESEDSPDATERVVAAAGMVQAASLLAGTYSLVTTNFPYLARKGQDEVLCDFADQNHKAAKRDLATIFVQRTFGWLGTYGAQAVVVPQSWLFLKSYRKLREELLTWRRWRFDARLGPGAFETIGGQVVNVALAILSADASDDGSRYAGLDVSALRGQALIPASEKARLLRAAEVRILRQQDQTRNPNARMTVGAIPTHPRLSGFASSYQGVSPADLSRFGRLFWEGSHCSDFRRWQGSPVQTAFFSGRSRAVHWGRDLRELFERGGAAWRGRKAAGVDGIAVTQMSKMPATLSSGDLFDTNVAIIVPRDPANLAPIWCFVGSPNYRAAVRDLDRKLNVTNATLVDVPFDLDHWKQATAQRYPNGLPKPYSDDPTQWVFHGHPCASVVWDPETKRTVEGPIRTDGTVLQVAVARLLGYRWPVEHDPDMRLADEARALVRRFVQPASCADEDGIVCVPAVRGEAPAADRLRPLLATAYGDDWSGATEQRLLAMASPSPKPAATLDDWLRNHFFEGHCRLFHQRPFVWHIWDGLPDGFSALVNYHRLAAPGGEGRRPLGLPAP
ncbi:MAG: SAM-dependent methyltransferase, partial [Rhodospirillales bacterium]|nr:SAM-dependent methyltransferase [Rhodospirillales bacterium]